MSMSQTVESFLADRQVPYTVHVHRASKSSLDSAHSAHVDEDCVAKSVLLADDAGFVLAVLPASRRLELPRVKRELGRALHLASEKEMVPLFPDCEVGAVPPVGAAYGIDTVIDASLEERDEVFFEAGDHETLVRVEGETFLDLLENAEVADIAADSPGLVAARVVRERLYREQLRLGRALSAPVGSGERWRKRVARCLDDLARALARHRERTESAQGVLREIVDQAPRLWREVDGLAGEHTRLEAACAEIAERLESGADPAGIRWKAQGLIGAIERHRHRGADLVYEAFGVDLGGG